MPADPHPVQEDIERFSVRCSVPFSGGTWTLKLSPTGSMIRYSDHAQKLEEVEGERDQYVRLADALVEEFDQQGVIHTDRHTMLEMLRAHDEEDALKARADKAEAALARIKAALGPDGAAADVGALRQILATPSTEERSAFQCATCPRDFEAEGHETLPVDWSQQGAVIRCPDCSAPTGTEERCQRPPVGWRCTRVAGHDGPCAAVEALEFTVNAPDILPPEQHLEVADLIRIAYEKMRGDQDTTVLTTRPNLLPPGAPTEGEQPGTKRPPCNCGCADNQIRPNLTAESAPATPEPEGDHWPEIVYVKHRPNGTYGAAVCVPDEVEGQAIRRYIPAPSKDRCPTCGSSNPWFTDCKDKAQAKAETGRDFPSSPRGCGDPWHEQATPSIPVGERELLLSDAAICELYCHLPTITSDDDAGPNDEEAKALREAVEAALDAVGPRPSIPLEQGSGEQTRTGYEVGAIYENRGLCGGAFRVLGETEDGQVEVEQVVKGSGGKHYIVGDRWTHRTYLDHCCRKIGYTASLPPSHASRRVRVLREGLRQIDLLIGASDDDKPDAQKLAEIRERVYATTAAVEAVPPSPPLEHGEEGNGCCESCGKSVPTDAPLYPPDSIHLCDSCLKETEAEP